MPTHCLPFAKPRLLFMTFHIELRPELRQYLFRLRYRRFDEVLSPLTSTSLCAMSGAAFALSGAASGIAGRLGLLSLGLDLHWLAYREFDVTMSKCVPPVP